MLNFGEELALLVKRDVGIYEENQHLLFLQKS